MPTRHRLKARACCLAVGSLPCPALPSFHMQSEPEQTLICSGSAPSRHHDCIEHGCRTCWRQDDRLLLYLESQSACGQVEAFQHSAQDLARDEPRAMVDGRVWQV